jgi:hypothetical protein
MLEQGISEATGKRFRENMQACLGWLKKCGYPIDKYEIWASDGVIRCLKTIKPRHLALLIAMKVLRHCE